jgi:hypothetical protein
MRRTWESPVTVGVGNDPEASVNSVFVASYTYIGVPAIPGGGVGVGSGDRWVCVDRSFFRVRSRCPIAVAVR